MISDTYKKYANNFFSHFEMNRRKYDDHKKDYKFLEQILEFCTYAELLRMNRFATGEALFLHSGASFCARMGKQLPLLQNDSSSVTVFW